MQDSLCLTRPLRPPAISTCTCSAAQPVLGLVQEQLITEQVDLLNPVAGGYTVHVHGFNVPGTANFTLSHWLLSSASAGNMSVSAPGAATQGATGTIGMTFSGL